MYIVAADVLQCTNSISKALSVEIICKKKRKMNLLFSFVSYLSYRKNCKNSCDPLKLLFLFPTDYMLNARVYILNARVYILIHVAI